MGRSEGQSPRRCRGGPTVRVYLSYDRDPTQRRGDYAWRMLKRFITEIREKVSGDARDRSVAVNFTGVARLRFDSAGDSYKLVWLPHAEKAFSADERKQIEKQFEEGARDGTAWG